MNADVLASSWPISYYFEGRISLSKVPIEIDVD